MEVSSVPGATVLHWYKHGWHGFGRHHARITYDDKKTVLACCAWSSSSQSWGTWELDMWTDDSRSSKMMHMTKHASWPTGLAPSATFDDRVSKVSFDMSKRAFACKFEFVYDGTAYAWHQTTLVSGFCAQRMLTRYPEKTEVALFDTVLSTGKVGKIHVHPRSELPLHVIAGTLFMMHTIEVVNSWGAGR
jgi:hypothetical protein